MCSGDSNFQMHRFAHCGLRAIQNRCHARRISTRELRRCDYSEDSNKNSSGRRHSKVHLASVIPSAVEESRSLIHGRIHGISRLGSTRRTCLTSPYRHGALLCVHQVEPAPPRLSSIPEELPPGARSSGPPFRVRLRQLVRSRQAVASVICLRRLPSLHPQISWILQESRKVSYFPLHPLLGMVRGFHFRLRPGSAILHLAVLLARVKAVDLVACRLPAKEKESPQAAAVFFAARSSPGLGRFFPVADLSDFQTCLVIADLGTAAGLFAAARPDLVVAADSVVAVFVVLAVFAAGSASDPACSVCPVYSVRSSAAARGKGRAVLVVYSSVLRSSASRNRNCPSLPCFAGRA